MGWWSSHHDQQQHFSQPILLFPIHNQQPCPLFLSVTKLSQFPTFSFFSMSEHNELIRFVQFILVFSNETQQNESAFRYSLSPKRNSRQEIQTHFWMNEFAKPNVSIIMNAFNRPKHEVLVHMSKNNILYVKMISMNFFCVSERNAYTSRKKCHQQQEFSKLEKFRFALQHNIQYWE